MNTTATSFWPRPPRRIAVFRARPPDDLLSSVPALRALRAASPDARITLVGKESADGFVQRFSHYVDDLLVFPCLPGSPIETTNPSALPAFYAAANARKFDVAIQLHDDGEMANTVVAQLGAQRWAGFMPPHQSPASPGPSGTMAPDPWLIPWPVHLPEVLRYTALMQHLGISVNSTELEFPLTNHDYEQARSLLWASGLNARQTVLLHPGSHQASRRWPVERFAQLAGTLAAHGWQIAITGSQEDRPVTSSLRQLMNTFAIDLTGVASGPTLAALIAQCRLVVCNDSGISHMAAAVHTPSVVVASGRDVNCWTPPNRDLHTVLWRTQADDLGRRCGRPNDIGLDQVVLHVKHKLATGGVHA